MEALASWTLIISIMVSGLGSSQYFIRENSTVNLINLVNEYDVPYLIMPYFNHESPEVRMRAQRIFKQYYNPFPSKEKSYPRITSHNGVTNHIWREAFDKGFEMKWEYEDWNGGNGIWKSKGESAERIATLYFVQERWKQTLGPRKKVVDFLDEMWENERKGEVYMMPDVIVNQYGMGGELGSPIIRK